jgi:hypothetical protein
MATIIDALLVKFGLDSADYKKGVDEVKKSQDDLDKSLSKSKKRQDDEEKKRREEEKKNRDEEKKHDKEIDDRNKAVIENIRKIRNETLGLIGLYMAGMGVKNFIQNTVDQAASLKFLSENLGMTAEKIQAYERASKRMGGTAEGMLAQLKESQADIAKFQTGQGASPAMVATYRGAAMAGMSVSPEELKSGNSYLMARSRIIAALYKQNAANAAQMAQQMGISEDQFNLIRQGPEAIAKLVAAQEIHSAISKKDADNALALRNRWMDFTDSLQVTSTKILVALIPAFKTVIDWLTKFSDQLNKNKDGIVKWINDAMPKIVAGLNKFAEAIQNVDWKNIIDSAKVLLNVIAGIASAVVSIVAGIKDMGAAIQSAMPSWASDLIGGGIAKFLAWGGNADARAALASAATPAGAGMAAGARTSYSQSDIIIGSINVYTSSDRPHEVGRAVKNSLVPFRNPVQANTGAW